MNVNESNHSASSSSAAAARARTAPTSSPGEPPALPLDGHLAELARSLCALAAGSPERQAKIQNLMRTYAAGDLQVDAAATAAAMVDDAFGSRWVRR